MAVSKHDHYPVIEFRNSKDFEKWLAKNHHKEEGVWLKMAKAKTGVTTVTYLEAVDLALCYGWIDGMARRVDEIYYVQKFTPRQPRSIWSVINRNKVEQLIKAGKMKAAGLAAIEIAKNNGRWDAAYHSPKSIQVPGPLADALQKNRIAKENFDKLDSTNRYAMLFRLSQLKQQSSVNRKVAEYVKMLEDGKTIYNSYKK